MDFELTRLEAPTMNEALEQIRTRFGDRGIILGTRTYRRGGLLGVGGEEVVEVYVTGTQERIENVQRHRARAGAGTTSREPRGNGDPPAAGGAERRSPGAPGSEEPVLTRFSSAISELREDVKALLARAPEQGGFSHPFLRECYDLLVSRDVHPRIADNLVREIANLKLPAGYPDPSRTAAIVRQQIAKVFPASAPVADAHRPRLVVLVGPTGVGKTTTIAKLAARAKINERRRVGLVTLDTFRIAAVDQLQKYARIIDVTLDVVANPAELRAAVAAHREGKQDVVFIDSAGRSHRDELKMAELKEFLAVIPEAEVHLVLSSTTHPRTFDSVAERFEPLGYRKVILTKIDESVSLGPLVASLIRLGRPVSFITDGQNVPDDIMTGDPDRLADFVLRPQSY